MAINRFFKPVDYEYTPIPFQELVTLGKYYADERKQAEKDLATNIKTFGKFVSPSVVDMENYKKASIGKLAPFIEQAAVNPSLMKDPAFRAQMQSQINNIDYTELGRLEQSRDNMIQRQKYNSELALKGLYDPLLHDIDFENYDSTKGIFQDVSPLPYMNMHNWVKGWVDNLDYEFQEVTPDGWAIHAVTDAMTDAQLRKNWSAIQTDPYYSQHRTRLLKMGISEENVDDVLQNEIFTAGREFTKEKAERDPWWMKQRQREWELADAAKNNVQNPNVVRNLTEILQGDASMLLIENFTNLTQEEKQNYAKLGINSLPLDKQRQINDLMNQDKIGGKLFNEFIEVSRAEGSQIAGLNHVLNKMSFKIQQPTAEIYSADGTTGKKTNDGSYVASDSRNFRLANEVAFDMMRSATPGTSVNNPSVPLFDQQQLSFRFKNDWKNGNVFHDFIVRTDNRVVVGRGGKLYSLKYAYIPEEQFEGYTKQDMEQIGGTRMELGEDATTFTVRQNDVGEESQTTTTRIGKKNYIRVPITSEISQVGEYANTANARYLDLMGITAKTTDANVDLSNRQTTY